ncbi:hypothetical protein Q3A86_33845 [Streptomyces sp. NBUA17]
MQLNGTRLRRFQRRRFVSVAQLVCGDELPGPDPEMAHHWN